MKEFHLKLNRKLAGIRESSVGIAPGDVDDKFVPQGENTSMSASEAVRLRQLYGRIKILEMELQKAREESFRAGFEEGQNSTVQDANKRIEAMRIEMQAMELKYLETIEQIEEPLLELAKRMASEVLATDLKIRDDQDEILSERLRKMLYEVVDQNKIIVELHPEQLQNLTEEDLNAKLNVPRNMELNFIAGKDLQKGEARLKTEDYFVDGTFENQLEHLHDQLKHKQTK